MNKSPNNMDWHLAHNGGCWLAHKLPATKRLEKGCGSVVLRLPPYAPDWWESARFQVVFVAQVWLRQNGII